MGLTFDAWMTRVNAAIDKLCGCDSDDLPDYDYYNAYEDMLSPSQAARKAIRNAGGY